MALAVVYSNFGGRIVHSRTNTGDKRDYVPDTLGSVSRMLGPGQTVVNSYKYTPYGEVESFTGHRNPLEFVGTLGYYRDRFVGAITYVRARWYQASLSRWMTVDPLWPGERAYEYGNSSPGMFVDESGMCPALQGNPCPKKCSDYVSAIGNKIAFGILSCMRRHRGDKKKIDECIRRVLKGQKKNECVFAYIACLDAAEQVGQGFNDNPCCVNINSPACCGALHKACIFRCNLDHRPISSGMAKCLEFCRFKATHCTDEANLEAACPSGIHPWPGKIKGVPFRV